MFSLTQREQVVILLLLGLFFLGLVVRQWRQVFSMKNTLPITHQSLLSQ